MGKKTRRPKPPRPFSFVRQRKPPLAIFAERTIGPVVAPANALRLTDYDTILNVHARLSRGSNAAADDATDHGPWRTTDQEARTGADRNATRSRGLRVRYARRNRNRDKRRCTDEKLTHGSILLFDGAYDNDFARMTFRAGSSSIKRG
jgi:hypothetical protein